MYAAQRAQTAFAQQARGLLQRRRDTGQSGLDAAHGHDQKANYASRDQHHAQTHQRQALGTKQAGQPGIQRQRRSQQTNRQHRARHGVTQGRQLRWPARRRSRADAGARGPGHDKTRSHRNHGHAQRQPQRVEQAGDQALGHARALHQTLAAFPGQIGRWRSKADQHRQAAGQRGQPGSAWGQAVRRYGPHALGRAKALATAALTLQPDQGHHGQQHGAGNLRGTGQIGARDPGGVDRHRERVHAQKLGRTDIVERLQQRQAQAHDQCRPRHGQGHAPKSPPAGFTQRACSFHQMCRLGHEHGPCRHIHIGVEREPQHKDRAAHGAQIRQAPLARAFVTQQPAQRALHRAYGVKQIQIGKGHDIGRHGQRQQQRPVQPAPPRKIAGRHQPGAARAHHQNHQAHPAQQPGRIGGGIGQHIAQQILPVRPVRPQRQPGQRGNGRKHPQRNQPACALPHRPDGPQP